MRQDTHESSLTVGGFHAQSTDFKHVISSVPRSYPPSSNQLLDKPILDGLWPQRALTRLETDLIAVRLSSEHFTGRFTHSEVYRCDRRRSFATLEPSDVLPHFIRIRNTRSIQDGPNALSTSHLLFYEENSQITRPKVRILTPKSECTKGSGSC